MTEKGVNKKNMVGKKTRGIACVCVCGGGGGGGAAAMSLNDQGSSMKLSH